MSSAAVNYGNALYELAKDHGLAEKILGEFEETARLFTENPDYVRVLSLTSLSKAERCGLLDKAFAGKAEQYLLNGLKVMLENGHIRAVPDTFLQYKKRFNEDAGIDEAVVYSATALSDAQKSRLTAKLAAVTGKKIVLQTQVDPSLIGGIRLKMNGQQYDGSVRERLDRLQKILSETVI
ncbi:MAG: ATP synthase F1 subunit delta [Lachnospiraceae bacterium]|nr:ATP synthase F1 subunit delta [Lachnospiraceae bacterium]